MPKLEITIHGRIPSKKNEHKIVKYGKRTMICPSKKYIEWERGMVEKLQPARETFVGKTGLAIVCDFYMPDAIRCDLSNKFESVADVLCHKDLRIIDDDRASILSEVHLVYRGIDRENPRAEITIF